MLTSNRSFMKATTAVLFLLMVIWPSGDLLARRAGRSFGGRSSSKSFSSSKSWGNSSKRSTTSNSSSNRWGMSNSQKRGGTTSAADDALGTKVNRAGNANSRSDASTFRETTAARSVPQGAQTRWDREPSTRPDYIPYGATLRNGSYANVYFNPGYGGYGYFDSLGNWMMWNTLLNSGPRSYYYGGMPGGYSGYPRHYGSSNSFSLFGFLLGMTILVVLVIICVQIYRRQKREMATAAGNGYGNARGRAYNPFGGGNADDDFPDDPNYADHSARPVSRRSSMTPASRKKLADWTNFPPGSFITLNDDQTRAESQRRGKGFEGIRYAVQKIGTAEDMDGLANWVLIYLNDGMQPILLMVKEVDGQIDTRTYFAHEGFQPARREALLDRGDFWLFEPPLDENHYVPADLKYTAEINVSTETSEVIYVRKAQGERQADYTERPAASGMTEMLATLVEYSTSDATENPELLILEVGTAGRKTGEVLLFLGCAVRESEIDILRAQAAI